MDTPHIAFIGAGNMASSIIGGLLEAGHPAGRISAADPVPASLEQLRQLAPVATSGDNLQAITGADVVMLAVKPQVMADVLPGLAQGIRESGALTISIAAGVTLDTMQGRLGEHAAIVRCMPNTPALLRCGASALYANLQVSEQQREQAQYILSAVGTVAWVDSEADLDTVTALSGSGPAYFFLMMEAMIDAACAMGLDRDIAAELCMQTALGAARMALENDVDLAELRRRVTSPGGTTEHAIQSFEHDGLRRVVAGAMDAAARRSAEMAREMG